MKGAVCGAGYAYPFGLPDFTSGFHTGLKKYLHPCVQNLCPHKIQTDRHCKDIFHLTFLFFISNLCYY